MIELGWYWSHYSLWFLKPSNGVVLSSSSPIPRSWRSAKRILLWTTARRVPVEFYWTSSGAATNFSDTGIGDYQIAGFDGPRNHRESPISVVDIRHWDTQGADTDAGAVRDVVGIDDGVVSGW
jgi:hypothetical protein